MKNIFIVLFLLITTSSFSTTIISTDDGDWETAGTWDLDRIPTDNDTIIIKAGHKVELGNRIKLNGVVLEIGGEVYLYASGTDNDEKGRLVIDNASEIYILDTGSVTAESESAAYALIERTAGAGAPTTFWNSTDGPLEGPATIDGTDGLTYSLPSDYIPLPIELTTFKAFKSANNVSIYWQTGTEENNDYFTIERSADGMYYEVIATVNGAGNSSSSLDYSYTDINPLNGTAYYRLTQTDYDGKSETFDAVSLSFLNEETLTVGPNPVRDNLTITLGGEMGNADVIIYNMIGAQVKTLKMNTAVKTINVSDLPSGTYMLVLSAEQNNISKRIVVQ